MRPFGPTRLLSESVSILMNASLPNLESDGIKMDGAVKKRENINNVKNMSITLE